MAKRGAVDLVTYRILKLIARKHTLYAKRNSTRKMAFIISYSSLTSFLRKHWRFCWVLINILINANKAFSKTKTRKTHLLFSSKARFQGTSDLHGTKRCPWREGESKEVSGSGPREKMMHFTTKFVSHVLRPILEKLHGQVGTTNYRHKVITGTQTSTLSCWTEA